MYNLIKRLNHYFKKNKITNIILSISAGVDSVVLLHILQKVMTMNSNLTLSLYHINYNTHKNSNDAYNLCKFYSKKYNIQLYAYSINISKYNFESNARKIRYNNLQQLSQKYNFDLILTAHNYNDQIETLIMKDEDGSDWVSFLGIREFYINIFRPMLRVLKKDIYDHANKNSLKWIEDPTNKLNICKRNKIRNLLSNNFYSKKYIDELYKKYHLSIKKINDFEFDFNNLFIKYVKNNINNSILIDSELLENITNYIILKLCIIKYLKLYFNINNVVCTKSHWNNLYDFMKRSNQGKIFIIYNNICMLKDRGFYVLYIKQKVDNSYKVKLENNQLEWYGTLFKLCDENNIDKNDIFIKVPKQQIDDGLFITHWKFGDTVRFNQMNKKLSDMFINNKIPNYNKTFYPIIRNKCNDILWIPNILNKFYDNPDNSFYLCWNNYSFNA